MSIAPFAGIVALDNFKEPTVSADGLQGQVPKPLAGQQDYVLTASGFVPGGSIPGLGTMASQDADNVAITGGAINGTSVGLTTPAAGSFTTLVGGAGSANYGQLTGGDTGQGVQFQTLGTDANIAMILESAGTGAIDLAAGSRGINISNGGTVTSLTKTAGGSNYTTTPTVAISLPTTTGGVQAVAAATYNLFGTTRVSGGTGYTVNDVLTFVGGTYTDVLQYTVTSVSGGVITGTSVLTASFGIYSALPPSTPATVTGGTGTGATFNLTWTLRGLTITNAGSGYVEQPTVTFSGGGGSGAAAYASVGAGTIIRSLGSTGTQSLSFYVPSGEVLRLRDTGTTGTYMMLNNTSSGVNFIAQGTTNAFLGFNSNGTSAVQFGTNGNTGNTQLQVAHTNSAVNYVQVTGSATNAGVAISAQGSDTNISWQLLSKGTGNINFRDGASAYGFIVDMSGASGNYLAVTRAGTGSPPSIKSNGGDTNIDLTLLPKGAGNVRFGTYTGTVLAIAGYVEIKDAGGTLRKLAVVA